VGDKFRRFKFEDDNFIVLYFTNREGTPFDHLKESTGSIDVRKQAINWLYLELINDGYIVRLEESDQLIKLIVKWEVKKN